MTDPDSENVSKKPIHPQWEIYWAARNEWDRLNVLASLAHRRMQDAADVLESAGEMHQDHR